MLTQREGDNICITLLLLWGHIIKIPLPESMTLRDLKWFAVFPYFPKFSVPRGDLRELLFIPKSLINPSSLVPKLLLSTALPNRLSPQLTEGFEIKPHRAPGLSLPFIGALAAFSALRRSWVLKDCDWKAVEGDSIAKGTEECYILFLPLGYGINHNICIFITA